jgi:hypothetical protein
MGWSQFITIFFTAVITSATTNLFGYWKEKRTASSKYTERVLTELYIPILKIIESKVEPGMGFEGLDDDDIDKLIRILKDKPELFDPKLEKIIYSYYEMSYDSWKYNKHFSYFENDRKLLDYVYIAFNKTRKSLGLPYEKKYAYPWILQFQRWKKDWMSKRRIKKAIKKNGRSTSPLEDTE